MDQLSTLRGGGYELVIVDEGRNYSATGATISLSQLHVPPRSFKKGKPRKTWVRFLKQAAMFFVFVPPMLPALMVYVYRYASILYTSGPKCLYSTSSLSPTLIVGGDLSFEMAKSIDILWNLGVGHGYQALFALVTYRLATDTLMRITEQTPVTFGYFKALALYPTGLKSLYDLFKGLFTIPGWRAKLASFWLFLTAVLLLALPSLINSMAGYIQSQDVVVVIPGSENTVPWSKVKENLDNDSTIMKGDEYYIPSKYLDDDKNYRCVNPEPTTYQWGFSPDLFLIVCQLLTAWGIGSWGLWLDAQHNSQQRRKGRAVDVYSAIWDIAGAMREEAGPHVGGYSGAEMGKMLSKAAPIMYSVQQGEGDFKRIVLSSKTTQKMKLSFDEIYG